MKFSTVCLALAAVAAVSTVDAGSGDMGRLPHSRDDNDIFNSRLGHPNGNTGQRTKFADDMRSVGNKWPALCEIDSDGDGKTNGEELGDPCCQWIKSGYFMPEIFPKDDLSNPEDGNDTTNLAKPGTCPPAPLKIPPPPTPPTPVPAPTPPTPVPTPVPAGVTTPTPTPAGVTTPTPTPTPTPTQVVHTVKGVTVEIEGGGGVRGTNLNNSAAAGLMPAAAAAVLCVLAALL